MNLFSRISIAVRRPVVRLVPMPVPMTYIGPGTAGKTGELLAMMNVRKALVITGGHVGKLPFFAKLLDGIRKAGVGAVVFDGVRPDPTFSIVEEARKNYAGCDGIVAVGGGSVLDAAKAAAAAAASGKPAVSLAGLLKVGHRLPPMILIPTTAGTGSETTVAAVISDSVTHRKKQILDPKLIPEIAVLDPELTVGMPPLTTAGTSMDALTHALEAYVSGYAEEKTDRDAGRAVKLIYGNLPQVLRQPDDLAAREALLVASFLAGRAFTRTYVGYVHAFAHAIGGRYGVPHGIACAVLLPHVMEYYLPTCSERFAALADLTGVCPGGGARGRKARAFVDSLFERNREAGIPARLEKFPASDIDGVIAEAFRECHGTYPVPRYYSRSGARGLLEKVCREE